MTTSDAKVDPKDAPPPSTGTPPPSSTPETFTEEQVAQRHSKLDKKIAELEKQVQSSTDALGDITGKAKIAEEALRKHEDEKDQRDLATIKESPDALAVWQGRQELKEERRGFEAEKAEFGKTKVQYASELEESKVYKTLKDANEIAAKPEYANVKAADLVDLTDGSHDKMEALAKKLSQEKPPEAPPDQGQVSGAGGELTSEDIEKMPMEQYQDHPSVKARYK